MGKIKYYVGILRCCLNYFGISTIFGLFCSFPEGEKIRTSQEENKQHVKFQLNVLQEKYIYV